MAEPRKTWGRFELRGSLGRGSSGDVQRAFDPQLGCEVALKVLIAEDPSPTQLERFAREGRIAATLDHPGIVPVVGSGEHDGRPYLLYELVEGGSTLAESADGLPLAERLEHVLEVAEAIGYAHARGVVHRDVKLENVLVDDAGRVRVTDFGVANVRSFDRLTATGTLVGTPSTMAPEQIAAKPDAIGPWTDVWALGVVLYRLVTGKVPFEGSTLVEIAIRIREGTYTPVEELAPEAPPAVVRVIQGALRVDPAQRFRDGATFATALRKALEQRAEREVPASAYALSGLAIALTGVGAALGVWSLRGGSEPPEPAAATPSPPAASVTTTTETAETTRARELAVLLDGGDYLAAVDRLTPPRSRRERLWRGLVRYEIGDYRGAGADWSAVGDGTDGLAACARAHRAMSTSGASVDAESAARDALLSAPEEPAVLWAYLRVSNDRFKLDQVRAGLAAAEEHAPKAWWVPMEAARYALTLGDRAEALRQLERARARCRGALPVRVRLLEAALAGQVDDPSGVVRSLNLAIKSYPRALYIRMIRALVRGAMGWGNQKRADLDHVKAQDPELYEATASQIHLPRELAAFIEHHRERTVCARTIHSDLAKPLKPLPSVRRKVVMGEPWEVVLEDFARLERAATSDPVRHRIQLARAVVARCRGRFAEAKRLSSSLVGVPGRVGLEARLHAAICRIRTGETARGYREMEVLAEEHPKHALGLSARAFLYLGPKGRDLERAVSTARAAIKKGPMLIDARLTLALALALTNKHDAARAEMKRCARIAPDLPRYQLISGLIRLTLKGRRRGCVALSRFIRTLEKDGAEVPDIVRLTRANVARGTSRYALALTDYAALLRTRPGDPTLLVGRGLAYRGLGRHEAAEADWKRAAQDPRFKTALSAYPRDVTKVIRAAIGGP